MFNKEWLKKNAVFGCEECRDAYSMSASDLRVWKGKLYCSDCFDDVCDEDELEWYTLPLLYNLLWGNENERTE